MKYRQLGNSDLKVSVLGLGTLHFGVFCDLKSTKRIIHKSIDLGINFIDTAPLYGKGNSEIFIKEAIKGQRDKVILSTKVGLEPNFGSDGSFGVSVKPLTEENIRDGIEKSLLALGTDYIDLFQVHAFDPNTPIEVTLHVLEELVNEGKIRYFGCSNYDDQQLKLASDTAKQHSNKFVSCQIHYNMIERKAEHKMIPLCVANDISVICYRAMARGILSGKYRFKQPLPENSRAVTSYRVKRWLSKEILLLIESLDKFSMEHRHNVAELSLAWLFSDPNVSLVVIGVRDLDQLNANVRSVQWDLTAAERLGVNTIIEQCGLMNYVNSMPEVFLEK